VLCARARVVHGLTVLADVQQFVMSQEIWAERFPGKGAPGHEYVGNVWRALNPADIDLCANLGNETIQRTAAEERQAAMIRARETVNRWYGIERQLIVERDAAVEADESGAAKALEERIGKAQERRMEAEEQLTKCLGLIDDESFESAPLRSEVLGILARSRAHFTDDECARARAIFAPADADEGEIDPDLPGYMQ
jgi:hypothetical protein